MKRSWGRDFEKSVLGVDVEWDAKTPYVEFGDAIEHAVFKQPNDWDPINPPTVLGSKLLSCVRESFAEELLTVHSKEVVDEVLRNTGLYVALGTPADFYHQTDAVILCDLGDTYIFVTIDLKFEDNGEREFLSERHFVIARDHFYEVASNNKLRIQNVAGIIAEQLANQLDSLLYLEERKAS